MRIRKRVDSDGVKADIAINVGEPGGRVKAEQGHELPDREGTYDELREEASRRADREQAGEGEQHE